MMPEHKPFDVMGVDYCLGCKDYQEWPCRTHLLAALAAASEREQAYRAALEMAERNTVYEIALTSYPPGTVRMCRICDQSGPVHGPAIDHAPDCPFAVLAAGGPADGRGEG